MEHQQLLAILIVLLAVAVALYAMRRYGAGYGARSVVCPHTPQRASISTFWITRKGASTCDVLQCSLLPGGKPVTCDKSCLAQL